MLELNFPHRWQQYYSAVAGRPPRDTLLNALDRFDAEPTDAPRLAIDLGCGEGRDTVEILRRGWRVLAIDATAAAIDRLVNRPDLPHPDHLETQVERFETIALPSAALINASFCLPFCPPDAFPQLWQQIFSALEAGGRFAGHLFGDRDAWATIPEHTHHTRQQIEALLQPFEVEMLNEEETDGKTALGEPKHWHIFHIVARKPVM
jgi:SAM-dependent methyltransferase